MSDAYCCIVRPQTATDFRQDRTAATPPPLTKASHQPNVIQGTLFHSKLPDHRQICPRSRQPQCLQNVTELSFHRIKSFYLSILAQIATSRGI